MHIFLGSFPPCPGPGPPHAFARSLPAGSLEGEGCDRWCRRAVQSFFHLTLPVLGRVLAVAVLIRTVDLFWIYDYIYAMTGGGPGTVTETLNCYAGRAFGVADFSYAATLSLITLIVLNVTCFLFIKLARVKF